METQSTRKDQKREQTTSLYVKSQDTSSAKTEVSVYISVL